VGAVHICNLYSMTKPLTAMRDLFGVKPGLDRLGNAEPLPAIFPHYSAPIVRRTADGERGLVPAHWGFLMPQVSKKTGKPIMPKAVNNTRDDKAATSGFWRSSFKERHCLIPATAFCEPKGTAPATYHWFGMLSDEGDPDLFAFAGIWRNFRGNYRDELVEIDTYSMMTTKPNELVHEIHPDRMPVILSPGDYETWLSGSVDEAKGLMRAYPAEQMVIIDSGQGDAMR